MRPLSASQINTFRLCQRRWGYETIERRRSPQTEAMAAGTALHAIMEGYLKHGTWPDKPHVVTLWNPARDKSRDVDLVELAKCGLPFLPHAGTATVEGKFTDTIGGVAYTGFIDLHHRREDVLTVQDHKTSSDPKRYGMHEHAKYLNDPQALIYAMHVLTRNPLEQVVCLEWVYYATKGKPRAVATAVLLTRAEVTAAFESVVAKAATAMVQIRKKGLRANTLPRNTDACMEWHRPCDHTAYCKPFEGDSEDMSGMDDFFNDTPPAKAESPSRDLLSDLEPAAVGTDDDAELAAAQAALAKAQKAKAEKAAKAKAAEAAAAQAKRDLINAPEKPAGVGLPAQGIPALGNAKPKEVLLALADLLTKIAGTMALLLVVGVVGVVGGCYADTTPHALPDAPEIVGGAGTLGDPQVAVTEQALSSIPLPEDMWGTAYRATAKLMWINQVTGFPTQYASCAVVNGGHCFAPHRRLTYSSTVTETWQNRVGSSTGWRTSPMLKHWERKFYDIGKVYPQYLFSVTENSYYYWFTDIPWESNQLWMIVLSNAGSSRFRAIRIAPSQFWPTEPDSNYRVWYDTSEKVGNSDYGAAVLDYNGMIMGYLNKHDNTNMRVEIQLVASEEID